MGSRQCHADATNGLIFNAETMKVADRYWHLSPRLGSYIKREKDFQSYRGNDSQKTSAVNSSSASTNNTTDHPRLFFTLEDCFQCADAVIVCCAVLCCALYGLRCWSEIRRNPCRFDPFSDRMCRRYLYTGWPRLTDTRAITCQNVFSWLFRFFFVIFFFFFFCQQWNPLKGEEKRKLTKNLVPSRELKQ